MFKPQVALPVTASETKRGGLIPCLLQDTGQCASPSGTRHSTESSCSLLHISLANAQASLTLFPAAPAVSCKPCWTMLSAVLSTQDNTTQFPSVIVVCQTCAHNAPSAAYSSHPGFIPWPTPLSGRMLNVATQNGCKMTLPVLPATGKKLLDATTEALPRFDVCC